MKKTESDTVVTRIAPSPTGLFHIGTARSALFNYLFAKQHQGTFIVRIEDTDVARSEKQYEENILEGLSWLELQPDALERQSERTDYYVRALDALITSDKAYLSKEPSRANPAEEVEVVRLRNPGVRITFHDEVRGEVTFDTTELGDFVIARSRTDPLYHLAVVVDDVEMGVTHVIRGEDHISNTPRQILIQEALGYARPVYAHLPLILAPDKSKMSKRKGAVSVSDYKAQGILPQALVNYLALLGWNPGTDKEIYTMEELLKDFSLSQIQKGGAVFDMEKLKWLNKVHRAQLPIEHQRALFIEGCRDVDPKLATIMEKNNGVVDDMLERYATTSECRQAVQAGEYAFYTTPPTLDAGKVAWKKDDINTAVAHLHHIRDVLDAVPKHEFSEENVKGAVWEYANEKGRGSVLWPFRYALSGADRSPNPFLIASAIGKEETTQRIDTAILLCTHDQ